MTTLEQTVETLQRRMTVLEEENARLRRQGVPTPSWRQGASRRQVLVGGAGVLGALAGGTLLGRGQPALAAPIAAAPSTAQKHETLRVVLTPLQSRGVHWAHHEWALGPQFQGEQAPVVVATAVDDYMAEDVREACSCSVLIHGTPGAYHATLMVRNVSSHAREVTIQAIAIGD